MPKKGVVLNSGWPLRDDHYPLIRKHLWLFPIEPGFTSVAKFEHGIVTISKKLPETATLYWSHTPALARPTLDDTSGTKANRVSRTASGGTRVTLEERQKDICAAEIAGISMAARSKAVRGLSELAVLRGILLFKHIVKEVNQPSDFLTERIHGIKFGVGSVV